MAKNHPKLIYVGLKSCFGVSMAFSGGLKPCGLGALARNWCYFLGKPSRQGVSMTAGHPKPSFEGLKLVSGVPTVIVAAVKLRSERQRTIQN